MRELLQHARSDSPYTFHESNNAQQYDQRQPVPRPSVSARQHESHGSLGIQDTATYGNGQACQMPMPVISPDGLSAHSHYDPHYGTSSIGNPQPLKRKRSCFEIRDDAIADFIDKGLITPECAVSCFNTYVVSTKVRWKFANNIACTSFFDGCVSVTLLGAEVKRC